MTERKWTPGPWVCRTYTGDEIHSYDEGCMADPEETYYVVKDADGDTVCDSADYYPARLNPLNAHLIAAAPDLYEALCVMIKYCNAEPGTMGYPGTQAAAALSKARGES